MIIYGIAAKSTSGKFIVELNLVAIDTLVVTSGSKVYTESVMLKSGEEFNYQCGPIDVIIGNYYYYEEL